LITLTRRVRISGRDISTPRLPAQADALVTAATAAWAVLAGQTLRPLSAILVTLADLTRRLAAMLNLAAVAGGDGHPTPQTSPATVKRAVLIIDKCVVPAVRVLGPAAVPEVERGARRVIARLGVRPPAQLIANSSAGRSFAPGPAPRPAPHA
jgi:hypothetical protein